MTFKEFYGRFEYDGLQIYLKIDIEDLVNVKGTNEAIDFYNWLAEVTDEYDYYDDDPDYLNKYSRYGIIDSESPKSNLLRIVDNEYNLTVTDTFDMGVIFDNKKDPVLKCFKALGLDIPAAVSSLEVSRFGNEYGTDNFWIELEV